MSELKVDKVSPRTGNYVALNTVGMKNIIINGDMSIAQRGTSFTSDGFTVDRFDFDSTSTDAFTLTQETDVPTGQGFAKSLKVDCTTANASLVTTDQIRVLQKVEGQNLQYLKYGTSNAETLTLSFWVKSNKTGIYCAELAQEDTSYSSFIREYTISSSNTWEKITLTFPGDSSGVINNDNGAGLWVQFALGAGSGRQGSAGSWIGSYALATSNQVNLADTVGNEWYITGVQLEVGTTASDFEFLPVDVNLARCQRYFQKSFDIGTAPAQNIGIQTGELSFPSTKSASTANTLSQKYNFPVRMRSAPTMIGYNSNATNSQVRDVTASADCSSTSFASNKETGFYVSCTTSASTSVGNYLSIHFTASAEL